MGSADPGEQLVEEEAFATGELCGAAGHKRAERYCMTACVSRGALLFRTAPEPILGATNPIDFGGTRELIEQASAPTGRSPIAKPGHVSAAAVVCARMGRACVDPWVAAVSWSRSAAAGFDCGVVGICVASQSAAFV